MQPSRIAELLAPYSLPLTDSQLDRISIYIDILLHWNARLNLTAVRDEESIVTRHFGESLFAARHLFPQPRISSNENPPSIPSTPECSTWNISAPPTTSHPAQVKEKKEEAGFEKEGDKEKEVKKEKEKEKEKENVPRGTLSLKPDLPLDCSTWNNVTVQTGEATTHPSNVPRGTSSGLVSAGGSERLIDVGSGAGFPGLPIKIWQPEQRITLIESNHKKVTFLREVIRALGLEGAEVYLGRAEGHSPSCASTVTLRAVERFEHILPVAATLVRPEGRLALLVGAAQVTQAKALLPEVDWQIPIAVPLSSHRVLVVGQRR